MSEAPQTNCNSLTLSQEVIDRLHTQVTFADDAALGQFVADAINSYLQLGQLHQQGAEFLCQTKGRDEPVVLRFPFARQTA
ncbi:hypothetical protein [Palleronia caenipelagi]|uniref:Uncharacterized protein n=1 Tax=Palleronia caenipelagi TaxID=2489174 RepID=A0A547PMZ7_9RHOB|nr:hypothetical protein [Palleronia caenipelagi]TRD15523.1 hypothetical protein FEV53_15975 [Palleronia caenipelagi]